MSEKSYRKDFITCFGMPIDENPTVIAMNAAFEQLGLDYIYNGSLVRPEQLGDAVRGMKAMNFLGSHVTVPHKIAVMEYLDGIDEDAALIGAVNTIYMRDGKAYGANTDGKGFLVSMEQAQLPVAGKHFVILGAGGAAKAIAVELALAGAASMTIVNRTLAKAEALASLISTKTSCHAEATAWNGTYHVPESTDILINCTDIGLYPDPNVPNIDYAGLPASMIVCDVIPNPPHSRFLQLAEERGCRTFDGLSMLVNQAIISLQLWSGKTADAAPMKAALAAEFGGA